MKQRESGRIQAVALELTSCVSRLHARGWCDGTGGNFSVVLERRPLRLLITPSGVDKGRLRPEQLLQVGPDGRPVDGGGGTPSAETPLHLLLVREASAGAVLHTHSVWGTLLGEHFAGRGGFSIGGYEMIKGIEGLRSHEERVRVPVVANSQDMQLLGREMAGRLAEHPAARGVLIAGHGLYVWGRNLDEARRHAEIYEFLFRLAGRRTRLVPFDGC